MDDINSVLNEIFSTDYKEGERVFLPSGKGYKTGEIVTLLAKGYCKVRWDSGAEGFYEMSNLIRDTEFLKSLLGT